VGVSVAAVLLLMWRDGRAPGAVARGGELVSSFRSEPVSFNRYLSSRAAEELFSRLTQARLVRINRLTNTIEPRLAQSWSVSDDHLSYTLHLRPDVRFSDGQPFTSADVLFTLEVAYDEASQVSDDLKIDGEPLAMSAPDAHTVVMRLPSPSALGLRLLDALPILPRHILEPAVRAGRLRDTWGPDTPPDELVGLGPFVLARYVAGQRLVFSRNPHFWRSDADGTPLPYLDRLTVEIVPEQNSEVLRLESGELDLVTSGARPEDVATFRDAAAAGRLQLVDVGIALDPDLLWLNLRPPAAADDPRQTWLGRDDFRRAIALAVDRDQFVNTVYLGAGVPVYGPVTPSWGEWYDPGLPTTPFDPEKARTLLTGLGLRDRTGNGLLEDPAGRPVRFTLLTQQGVETRERAAAVIQAQLARVGIAVDVVTLDQGALFQRFASGAYEAIYFGVELTDPDPAANLAFWLSSGPFHFWNPGQSSPATSWEARIDDLMRRQSTMVDSVERRRLFTEVQRVFAAHLPALYFAAPRVFVAMSPRVAHATPVVIRPQVLWNAEVLAVTGRGTD
jgi:peptide/nickel transport system substrate-binding protein